jgi:3-hydroxyisobutyrate dehydrogenase-like beta-hydroxyacid dehydrogenase
MVGADPRDLEIVAPYMAAYAKMVVHAGPPGSGVRLKLINQLLVSCNAAAAAEAAALIKALGLAVPEAIDALTSGWANSQMLERGLPAALSGDVPMAGATIEGLLTFRPLIDDLASGARMPELPIYHAAADLLERATQDGLLGPEDPGLLARFYDPDGSAATQ